MLKISLNSYSVHFLSTSPSLQHRELCDSSLMETFVDVFGTFETAWSSFDTSRHSDTNTSKPSQHGIEPLPLDRAREHYGGGGSKNQ